MALSAFRIVGVIVTCEFVVGFSGDTSIVPMVIDTLRSEGGETFCCAGGWLAATGVIASEPTTSTATTTAIDRVFTFIFDYLFRGGTVADT
ncbi:hypothetical protein LPA44_17225 [Halobacterium sp. KA-4]|uniref:hypothetical protein n=1 Tax=Halobacterium sp. KA-4 TaxID=2896367 RepID=UPI001E41C500|nr:hypothetical protein [Halobacterium sp. KA-4]MCD2201606.1 hypothetical protein [Halobacterium sp. KA-4]